MRVVLALLTLSLVAIAQESIGSVLLKVTDPSGAAVRSAVLLVAGVKSHFKTDALGQVSIVGLPAGAHRVDISKAGFETEVLVVEVPPASVLERSIMNWL